MLGHEFDDVRCAKGFGFKELCADYPQGWDWGVAAWVQWRHLRLQLDGLHGQPGSFTLHLQAFDPEGRGISQRVHVYEVNADRPELCVRTSWDLPKGLEGRWSAGSFCSIRLPPEALKWSALGVWISPLEKMKLHDWVAEQGAPGLVSHIWVTRDPN